MQGAALSADARFRRNLPLPGLFGASAHRHGRRLEAWDAVALMSDPTLARALRGHDRDRYQTALFAPADRRDALFALYAFNYEVARIREYVREPMLGLIRLQWWRDALDEIYAGKQPRRHEVATPLAAAIVTHRLSKAHFTTLLDARAHDMEDAPPQSMAALEEYVDRTSGALNLLALEVLGIGDARAAEAARAAGTAYALAGLLAAAPFHAQFRRSYLPADLTDGHGVDLEGSLFALKPSPALAATARDIAARARQHLDAARRERASIPRAALPVLLHATLAERRLKQLDAIGHDFFDPRLAREDTMQSLRLSWAAWRGVY
ncbi:MAG TPA: squalene/phytoene synthase family protein [Stellaceae bacterium]|nr:squalene/phytoene synthase family protein [Stellaceae bacterium]